MGLRMKVQIDGMEKGSKDTLIYVHWDAFTKSVYDTRK